MPNYRPTRSFRWFFVVLLPLLSLWIEPASSLAQSPAMSAGVIDYPVPEPLAAYGFSDDAAEALYPMTVRTYTAGMSGSFRTSEFTPIITLEVAPVLLSRHLTLSEYLASRAERVFLRTRISAALSHERSGRIGQSFGLRFMLHDDADWRADSSLYKLLRTYAALTNGVDTIQAIEQAAETIPHDILDSARDTFARSMWDRSVVEMGFAVAQNRAEDSGRTFQVLTSGAFPLILEKLQLNVGLNARFTSLAAGHATDLSASAGLFTDLRGCRTSLTSSVLRDANASYHSTLHAATAVGIGGGFWFVPELHIPIERAPVTAQVSVLFGATH